MKESGLGLGPDFIKSNIEEREKREECGFQMKQYNNHK